MNGITPKTLAIAGVIAVVVAIGGYLLLSSRSDQSSTAVESEMPADQSNDSSDEMMMNKDGESVQTEENENIIPEENADVTIDLTAKNFAFSKDKISVKKGQTVKIVLTSTEGFHDWVIDEFDASTERVQSGQTAEITLLADKTGSFEYYCSVGNHRQQGMVGTLVVTE